MQNEQNNTAEGVRFYKNIVSLFEKLPNIYCSSGKKQ